jgi:Predicted transcriptional regulator
MTNSDLSDPITLRLPRDVLAAIERIAGAADRTRSWVMVRALRQYLNAEGAEILGIAEGKEQLDKGEAEDMDDVILQIERIVRGNAA